MSDTIDLLQECNKGIGMGIDSLDKALEHVNNDEFKSKLINYKNDYIFIKKELESMLKEYETEGKGPGPIAKGMATIKTEIKLGINDTDATIADLMTDGCHMGVKTLNKQLNRLVGAKDKAKELCKKLIRLMDNQEFDLRKYL